MEFENKKLRSVAEAAARIMMGEKALHPNQQKLDVHEPEKDKLTSHDFKKLRSMKKEETMHEESCECGDCPSDKDMKKEEVELEEADTLLARTGMNLPHKFPRSGQTNLGNIPAMNTPGNSKETDAYAEKRRGDRAKQLKPAIKAALGTHGPKGKLPEEVDLDEGKMGQLDADLKDLSHDDFQKEYGKPKHHYDPSNFKKPVQKGQEMNRAKSLAQRAMASMRKEEVEEIEELSKSTLASYAKKATSSSVGNAVDAERAYAKGYGSDGDTIHPKDKKSVQREVGAKKAIDRLAKEEVEELEEMFPGTPEYEKKYGKAPQDMKKGEKKKTTQGEMEKTGKGVVHRRKFSEMIESYTEGGVKGLFRVLAEEPTSAEFDAQLADAKQRAAGTKKQPEVSKPAVQAVQNEEYELTLEDFTPEELEEFMQTEEYEQLDELSKSTLGSYVKKASKDAEKSGEKAYDLQTGSKGVDRSMLRNASDKNRKKYEKVLKKVDNLYTRQAKRDVGVKRATSKMKEEVESIEEYEQLDELSKSTLGSYVKKAKVDMVKGGIEATLAGLADDDDEVEKSKKLLKRRAQGTNKAVDRLTKEGVEQVEEQTHTTVSFIDYNDVNGVKYAEIDLNKKN